MELDSKVILSETHTSEYLLHKYWARKPHNVIATFLRELLPPNGLVIDPFCGSGVVLKEAQKQGFLSIGIDINPIAILNTQVITNPPNVQEFIDTVSKIIDHTWERCAYAYSINSTENVRYFIHSIIVKCSCCNCEISREQAIKRGKKTFCPKCNHELRFNLENMISTKITGICIERDKNIISDTNLCESQMHLSNSRIFNNVNESNYNFIFEENRRILAFKGMQTKDLFTVRNYNILCYVASQFEKISDDRIKNAALLLLTASVAQCSRLIPTRNNLSTGGPAWSVPGFWVPAQHLESNPIIHLRARMKKFEKGLSILNTDSFKSSVTIIKGDSKTKFSQIPAKADLIFLDPPYGDNIPYTEFSTIWNSFLKEQPKYDDDISVSDRTSRNIAWKKYNLDINIILQQCSKKLAPNGHLLITFNNNDIKAWEAIIGNLQKNGFRCDGLSYIIPAVVSSKAQFSPKGSYITDMYAVYSYSPLKKTQTSLNSISDALIKCASVREYGIAANLVYRTIMIEWVRKNIDSSLLKNIPDIVNSLFKRRGDMMYYIGPKIEFCDLSAMVRKEAKKILDNGPCEWRELYKSIAEKYISYGFLDARELNEYLANNIIKSKNICISYKE